MCKGKQTFQLLTMLTCKETAKSVVCLCTAEYIMIMYTIISYRKSLTTRTIYVCYKETIIDMHRPFKFVIRSRG